MACWERVRSAWRSMTRRPAEIGSLPAPPAWSLPAATFHGARVRLAYGLDLPWPKPGETGALPRAGGRNTATLQPETSLRALSAPRNGILGREAKKHPQPEMVWAWEAP